MVHRSAVPGSSGPKGLENLAQGGAQRNPGVPENMWRSSEGAEESGRRGDRRDSF